MLFFFVFSEISFQSFGKFTTGQHDAPSTALAFEPDVRAQARDRPFIGATGMLFAQAQMIVELQVEEHILDR
jgi:hypothetical protein